MPKNMLKFKKGNSKKYVLALKRNKYAKLKRGNYRKYVELGKGNPKKYDKLIIGNSKKHDKLMKG